MSAAALAAPTRRPTTERDFPFDASADVTQLRGLDRLRAISDRGTAAYLHALYVRLDPTWRVHERRATQEADYGVGGSGAFPDDYSAFDAVALPERGSNAYALWERKNALVFHAWQEFLENLEMFQADYLDRTGRELTRDQVAAHRERYVQLIRRQYGIAYADQRWTGEHDQWQGRK